MTSLLALSGPYDGLLSSDIKWIIAFATCVNAAIYAVTSVSQKELSSIVEHNLERWLMSVEALEMNPKERETYIRNVIFNIAGRKLSEDERDRIERDYLKITENTKK